MLTVLVTLWAASLVVLVVLLGAVIAVQGTVGFLRRLGGSWTASRRQVRIPEPARG